MLNSNTLLLVFAILINFAAPAAISKDEEATNCGYQSCHPIKEGLINVHIVAHTHDDVGWLKTVDQYYYGNNNSIQNVGVQYILDSVVDALKKDVNRRFIYVETAFFWKWWIHQHDFVKQQVRKFVNNGQLEFIGGAWSMNDEATTHYQSIVDQFTWGLRKLNDTFGECGRPRIGWQIDPFGHSKEMASLFAQLGFDGLLLGRIDYEDKVNRFNTKTPEMVWKASDSLGDSSDIFTGVMYNNYAPPKGFCFDILCTDEAMIDDKKSPLYNIDRKVDDFFAYLDNATKAYDTTNLIITMGEDFTYQDANKWFKNLDKLIYYANQRQSQGSKYNLLYSTPSCYIKAIHDSKKAFKAKSDDFFPYASDPHAFWTGYFVSRPTLKRFEREGNNFLQVCKQLYALTDLGPEDRVDLNALREAMGVMQHHDAVTGTEKQHVAEDYARILKNGFDECQFIVNTALNRIITQKDNTETLEIQIDSCLLANVSSCDLSENQESFVVTVYNPLSRAVGKYVRLPVSGEAYVVNDPDGKEIPVELIPTPKPVLKIPGRKSEAKIELIFNAADIPPLGFKSYVVKRVKGDRVIKAEKAPNKVGVGEVGFKISDDSGLLVEVTMNGKTVALDQDFLYYEGFVGDNREFANRSSGAYIFRPVPGVGPTKVAPKAEYEIFNGDLVAEVQQVFNEWASQTIRIYKEENLIEFDWLIGPIPNNEANGKEVITRFTSALKNQGTFYTDSNGRQLLKRQRNARPTWNLTLEEPVAGNYYPITSKIVMVDEEQDIELAVLVDRAQGGSSLADGEVEIMVHRNCLHDDAFGVGEALNETAFGEGLVARGSHYLIVGPRKTATGESSTAAQERNLAQRKLLDAWTFISPNNKSFEDYKAKYLTQFSGLKRSLPENVQILTLEPWIGFDFLLRLEHVLENGEDPVLSKPVDVDLKGLFTPFEIVGLKETTLGANQWLEDNQRLVFEVAEDSSGDRVKNNTKRATVVEARDDDFVITLNPMQIKTFVIQIKKN